MKIKLILLTVVLLTCSALAWDVKTIQIAEEFVNVKLKNKTLKLNIGIGSGAFHYKNDPANIFYTITDRGPNIKCKDSKKLLGKKLCKKGKIFLINNFAPTIYKIKLTKNHYEVLEKIQIKDANGNLVHGVSQAEAKSAYDIKGNLIVFNSHGLDPEALVKLSDGSFWIAEEFGPSILHISSDGKILKRVVPAGFEKKLKGANYKISSSLPAIIAKRPKNRGIESIAISKDENYIYFSMQSPLANPDKKTYKKSAIVRMFKYDIKADLVIGEYLYKMDKAQSFQLDHKKKQNAVKISEMVLIGEDELIIVERVSKTTKFYKVKFENSILGSKWDDIKTTPSLEQSKNLDNIMKKELILDTSNLKNIPKKIEGIAYINTNNWILINDNDFGIHKDSTYIIRLKKQY